MSKLNSVLAGIITSRASDQNVRVKRSLHNLLEGGLHIQCFLNFKNGNLVRIINIEYISFI